MISARSTSGTPTRYVFGVIGIRTFGKQGFTVSEIYRNGFGAIRRDLHSLDVVGEALLFEV